MAQLELNQDSDYLLTISTFDEAGLPQAPTTLSWSIYDPETGEEILPPTSIGSPTAVNVVNLLAAFQAVSTGRDEEIRRVYVSAGYSGGKSFNESYDYLVKRKKP